MRSTVVVGPHVSEIMKERLKRILLSMHLDPEGKKVMKTYYKVTKYDDFTGEAGISLDKARKLYPMIKSHLK